jgi:aspartyl-tRNA(Asn)/glutamyl-tRNA(Gln) amidotransferase subunit A
MESDLPFRSLTALSRLLATRATSSREIVKACLARIETYDPKLHAFVEVYAEAALAAADAADLERRAGLTRGPLHGLPIAVKDLLHLKGHATGAGSKSWTGRIADHTATALERLLAAGMIPLGKTHMVEFAFGGWGRNQPMGAPWNPWDPQVHRVAGGSSSGSAVAVAGGLAPAALGSDTGGSVRIPASLCGLTGLKTTYGLVSLYGTVPLSITLDSLGPLTHTVEDAALLTEAMAGQDPRDDATLNAPRCDFARVLAEEPDLSGMRIAVQSADQFPPYIEHDVMQAHQETMRVLRKLGAQVTEVHVPLDFADLMLRNGRLIAAEAYAVHRGYIEDSTLPIDPWVRKRVLSGKAIGAADYIDELMERKTAAAEFAAWMRDRDALLTPTLPITARPVEEVDEATTPLAAFTRAVNYLGACALSLPAGLSNQGLPIGAQLIAAPFREDVLVAIGRGFQRATDWHQRRPPPATSA